MLLILAAVQQNGGLDLNPNNSGRRGVSSNGEGSRGTGTGGGGGGGGGCLDAAPTGHPRGAHPGRAGEEVAAAVVGEVGPTTRTAEAQPTICL